MYTEQELDDLILYPGDRALVYDSLEFINDIATPAATLMKPATIISRYGRYSKMLGPYPDLVDVVFDHRPYKVSRGHFTERIRPLSKV